MRTLTLKQPLDADREPQRERMPFSRSRPYVDRGWRSEKVEPVPDPPVPPRVMLTLERYLRRQNSLQPPLQPVDRLLLRWGENEGTGLPLHDADVRETHFSPLPPDMQTKVTLIVTGSPWETLTRKWYRTDLTATALAVELQVSRTQLYSDWRSSLWYYRGRFEAARLYE